MSVKQNRLVIAESAEEFIALAATNITGAINSAIEKTGKCRLALSGGSTPAAIHAHLTQLSSTKSPDWSKVEFLFGDERCVPPDDKDSNFRMAKESLFDPLGAQIQESQIFRVRGEDPDREKAASDYANILTEPIDVMLLGMGEDGHTASLFPGQKVLSEKNKLTAVVNGPKPPPWRITVTPPVIEAAKEIIVLAKGAGKAEVLPKALDENVNIQEIPSGLARRGIWIVDREATASLK